MGGVPCPDQPNPEEAAQAIVKLAFVFGTRPEAIKMAPVILEARRRAGVEPLIISTGQHREMLRPVLDLFDIRPDIDLDLMRPNQTLPELASRALASVAEAIREHRPHALLVQGDTSTAMCAALAAFYERIPVAHVEAGLRSDRLDAPYPEELNRRVISQCAAWHLAPTAGARDYLLRDRLDLLGGKIFVTGNTVIDALYEALSRLEQNPVSDPVLQEVRAWPGPVVLITGHRRENFGEPFREFCLGLRDIAEANPDALLVYPVHLNPNVQQPVRETLSDCDRIRLVPPAGYPVFVSLMQQASLIITDSGGVQEEAPALGKRVLVTRDVTERPEAVAQGTVQLVGPHRKPLADSANALLANREKLPAPELSPYGDGKAAKRCIDALAGADVEEFHTETPR